MVETNAFSWLIADRLAACVNPSVGQQAAAELRTGGIRLLINLHEKPDPPELLAELGAETLHLPVASTYAPSQAQLDLGIAAIRDALQRGRPVAVHCASGLGRTGTLLAAFLVSQGATAEEAIEWVRSARPGSVETLEQEQAIYAYAQRVGWSASGRRGSGGPSQQEGG